jgi:hypothetical protein
MSKPQEVPEFMQEAVDQFLKKAENDPLYLGKFLTTLEINKIEDKYQSPGEPCIFRKEYDEFGVITDFTMDDGYKGIVPYPKLEFIHSDYERLLDKMESNYVRIAMTLAHGLAECAIQRMINYTIPGLPYEKKIDEDGLITSFKAKFRTEIK